MPSVGLRRTTRVFGVVKGADGARVLRSGRRLWPESSALKLRSSDGDEWFHTMKKSSSNSNHSAVKFKETQNEWSGDGKFKQERSDTTIQVSKRVTSKVQNENLGRDRLFGVVYSRKRKRVGEEKLDTLEEDKRFGIQFTRRPRMKKEGGMVTDAVECAPPELSVAIESGGREDVASFLSSVLTHVRRVNLRISELADFLVSEPVCGVFAMNGIHFSRIPLADRTGICKFFATEHFVPMFSVDFSAIPLCFMNIHCSLFFRVGNLSLQPVNNPLDDDEWDEMGDCGMDGLYVPTKMEVAEKEIGVAIAASSGSKGGFHPSIRASKLAVRNTQYKNGLSSRGIRKRRSSLRKRRSRNPCVVGMIKANGALVSDLITSRRNGIPFSSVVSTDKLRRSLRNSSTANLKKVTSSIVEVTTDLDVTSCTANLLVIEPDRCCRIKGATVKLESANSGEWVLEVRKDGSTRYTHSAQKVMKPCSFNRITHDTMWTVDETWKLEFPNRQDWLNFKELYKQCYERNIPASVPKAIPVPGVLNVLGYEGSTNVPFTRPHAYISMINDEVARALARRTASYDLDSEDEDWLKNFNQQCLETDQLTEDNFELMVDAFEKAFYCSPDDFNNEKANPNLCLELGRREVVESVYGYWLRKRKQKRIPLLRVFQGHQVKKAPSIPKPALRKRRSFKRPSSQFGRGKQPSLLQAFAAEHGSLGEQNAMVKVEEAKASARRSMESAILKRRRAQQLMENASLATYKAAMALRIAESARSTSSVDEAASPFLD